MAEGVAADVRQCNMPNVRLIYELITANNLAETQSQLNPLTIRHRQSIVSQYVGRKTLLGHACELGFRDIVKYLLDECEANISQHCTCRTITSSALRVSIDNLDLAMLHLLISRGAVAADKGDARSCLRHASVEKYISIASLLRNYTGKMAPPDDTSEISNLLTLVTNMNLECVDPFLQASASENIGRMKVLLANGTDTKATNNIEENALCIAILNEKSNAEHFLLNYRVFFFRDHVKALELCGAKFMVFRSEFEKGLRCWRKAIRIRTEYKFGVSDKSETKYETNLGDEFNCEEQLDMMANHDADLNVQALIVLLRLLSPFSQLLQIAFVTVAQDPAFRQDLFKVVKILGELAALPYLPFSVWASPISIAIATVASLFRSHFFSDYSIKGDILMKFRNLLDFINCINWKVLLRRQDEFHPFVYVDLHKRVLDNIITLNSLYQCLNDEVWIKDCISRIMKCHSVPYPTTLLHLAIEEPAAFSVIPFVLSCSHDANCTDVQKNTPMHTVSVLQGDATYLLHLVNLLADAGGHIDAVNVSNETPVKILKSKMMLTNHLKYLSLQCLAAQIIYENNIIVPEIFPKILVSFIKLHSR